MNLKNMIILIMLLLPFTLFSCADFLLALVDRDIICEIQIEDSLKEADNIYISYKLTRDSEWNEDYIDIESDKDFTSEKHVFNCYIVDVEPYIDQRYEEYETYKKILNFQYRDESYPVNLSYRIYPHIYWIIR